MNSIKFTNIIAAMSLLAVVVNFYFDYKNNVHQESRNLKYDSLQYRLNAQNYLPKLRMNRPPLFDRTIVNSSRQDFFPVETIRRYHSFVRVDSSPSVQIRMSISVVNVGNSLARVIFAVLADSMSFTPLLRSMILNPQLDTSRIVVKDLKKFMEVHPGDSTKLTIDRRLQFAGNGADTLHCLILYQNEIGNIYDTYIWIPISIRPISYKYSQIPGTDSVQVWTDIDDERDIVFPSGIPIESSISYSQSDAELIYNMLAGREH